MSEQLKPCPVCGKTENLILLKCPFGEQYEGDVFCRKCQCKIIVSKWNTRALTPKQQCADEMYELLETIENDDGKIPEWLWDRIRAVKAKARGEA